MQKKSNQKGLKQGSSLKCNRYLMTTVDDFTVHCYPKDCIL